MALSKHVLMVSVVLLVFGGGAPACKRGGGDKSSPLHPALLSVRITPESPKTKSDLSVLMESIEGSDLTFRYRWRRNGETILGETSKTLRHSNFSKHDTISVVVTPVQGEVLGKAVESDPVEIGNTIPIISSVIIKPQPAYTTSQLEAVVEALDSDGDSLVYSFVWMKNGKEIADETSAVLSSVNFKRGDSIQCKVTPSDRETVGNEFITEPIVIVNSPPSITSQPPAALVRESFFTYRVAADDPDQDELVFSLSSSVPQAISIDPETGTITWKIPKDLTGLYPIEVMVSDGHGGRCSQRFTLSVGDRAD